MLATRTKRRRSAVDYARLARGDDEEVFPEDEEGEPGDRLDAPEGAATEGPAVGRRSSGMGRRSLTVRRPTRAAVGQSKRSKAGRRLVISDDDSDDLLGVDEDASEDFVPGAVDTREEEDIDAEEEEEDGLDPGDREAEHENLKVVLRSGSGTLERDSSSRGFRPVSAPCIPGPSRRVDAACSRTRQV